MGFMSVVLDVIRAGLPVTRGPRRSAAVNVRGRSERPQALPRAAIDGENGVGTLGHQQSRPPALVVRFAGFSRREPMSNSSTCPCSWFLCRAAARLIPYFTGL